METNVPKERKCIKENEKEIISLKSKQIHVAIEKGEHEEGLEDSTWYRKKLDELIEKYPNRFPKEIKEGYNFHGFTRESKKCPGIRCRRIKLKADEEVYTILPYGKHSIASVFDKAGMKLPKNVQVDEKRVKPNSWQKSAIDCFQSYYKQGNIKNSRFSIITRKLAGHTPMLLCFY